MLSDNGDSFSARQRGKTSFPRAAVAAAAHTSRRKCPTTPNCALFCPSPPTRLRRVMRRLCYHGWWQWRQKMPLFNGEWVSGNSQCCRHRRRPPTYAHSRIGLIYIQNCNELIYCPYMKGCNFTSCLEPPPPTRLSHSITVPDISINWLSIYRLKHQFLLPWNPRFVNFL